MSLPGQLRRCRHHVLFAATTAIAFAACPWVANAQIDEAKQAQVLFDLRLDKIRTYTAARGLNLNDMVSNSTRGEFSPETVSSLSRVFGMVQVPKDMATMQAVMTIMNGPSGPPPMKDDGFEKKMPEFPDDDDGFEKKSDFEDDGDEFNNISFQRGIGNRTRPNASQEMELPLNFFVRFEFKDQAAADEFAGTMWPTEKSVEMNGHTLNLVPDNSAPTNLAFWRPSELIVEMGTTEYLTQATRRLFTQRLGEAWGAMADDAIRLAVDFESVSGLIGELVAMGEQNVPPPFSEQVALANSLSTLSLGVDLEAANLLSLVINCKDSASAGQLNEMLGQQLSMVKMLAAGGIAEMSADSPQIGQVAQAIVGSLDATQSEKQVSIIVPRPDGMDEAVSEGLVAMQAQAKVVELQNNLRQVALSVHIYHDIHGSFPFASVGEQSKDLSWRGRISQYMEGPMVDVNQPHSSAANSAFGETMPDSFGDDGKTTKYCVITHSDGGPTKFEEITDGTSNTIMLLENSTAIPWLKPGDMTVDQAVKLLSESPQGTVILAAMYDGSIRSIHCPLNAEAARTILTYNGGELTDY